MTYTTLTEEEQRIIAACLRAVVKGPFFPDWEFSTLFGLTRSEVSLVADRYPAVDEVDDEPTGNDDSWLAINNTFANLLGYPHGKEANWSTWIPVPISEVERIFGKWKRKAEPSHPANPRNAGE